MLTTSVSISQELKMLDLLVLIIVVAFFAGSIAYVIACEKL
jgi:hypothetical protein